MDTDFTVKICPALALVTLKSNFGGKKVQGGKEERHFSSKYSKEIVNETRVYFFHNNIKNTLQAKN